MKLAKITEVAIPSLTRQLFDKARKYDDVIDLTLGDPDFFTAPNVSEMGKQAITEGKTKYSTNAGIEELRKAISVRILNDTGVLYDYVSEVIVTVGAMGALYLAMKCLIDPGDEVIIPGPYWVNYAQQVSMCGGRPVIVDSCEDDNFALSVEKLEKAITPRTKILVINSPNNPTGQVFTKDNLFKIADIVDKHDLIIIADEAYRELIYDRIKYNSIASVPGMKKRLVLINSFSKTYSMTGWRIGYAAAPKELIEKMTAFQENIFSCAPMPSQYAAAEALNGPQDYTNYLVKQFEKRRNILVDGLNSIKGIHCIKPQGTFYAFANIKKIETSSVAFALDLLDKVQVALVPGVTYGKAGEGYVRIAFTVREERLKEAIERLKHYVEIHSLQSIEKE